MSAGGSEALANLPGPGRLSPGDDAAAEGEGAGDGEQFRLHCLSGSCALAPFARDVVRQIRSISRRFPAIALAINRRRLPAEMMKPILALLIALSLGLLANAADENWPRLRGTNGSGVASAASIPAEWTEKDFLWKIDLPGIGHGSPVVWDDKIFVLCADAETSERKPTCVNAADGSLLWSKTVKTAKFKGNKRNTPASSTAAVDAERVYFTWGTKDKLTMAAFSHQGEMLWDADLGPVSGGHGFGGSPIVVGELVVLNNDQENGGGNLLAVDAATGELRWKVERRSQRLSYSVPCVFQAEDGRELLIFTNWQHGFTVIDPTDGALVAEKSVFDTDVKERAISSPILATDDGLVIGTCGFTNNPKHCVAVRLVGDQLEEVWRIEKSVPHIPSVIAIGNSTYLWDDQGIVTCVDTRTGESRWRGRAQAEGDFFGSPVSDGEKIFCIDKEGNVSVIAVSDEGLKQLAFNRLGDECGATPAIAGGVMFVRTYHGLMAVRGNERNE